MPFSDQTYNLRIETDSGNYRITAAEAEKMDRDLDTLRKLVSTFPVAELKIEVTQQNPGRIRAATSLRLPARTLFAADEDDFLHPAWERCIRCLVKKVEAYKAKLGNRPVYEKQIEGTLHDVQPIQSPDNDQLQHAVDEMDYPRFRDLMAVYDESLEGRVGRWVQRYPEIQDQLGQGLNISEIVEEVYLIAFDQFADRPPLRLGEWLESLIDPAIQLLLKQPDEEKANLSFIQSAKAAQQPPNPASGG
jgi:ribosome-associated translation inhibitor RaiA